jgi:antitoxin VapB
MELRVKSAEAERLATELSDLTGENIADAVTKALAERIAREKVGRAKLTNAEIDARMAVAKHIRDLGRRFREDGMTSNHAWLYDENGLPW